MEGGMSRCSVCDPTLKVCMDDGTFPCEYMMIAEKPGRQEAFTGRILIGDAGEELNSTYLPLAGLDRAEVYCDNAVRCWLGMNNNKPTDKQIEACASNHLPGSIARCEPSIIFLLGATACSLIPEIEIDKDHGIPIWVDSTGRPELEKYFGDWSGWVFPSFHPAAALHSTSMMIPLLEDFERFKLWRAGKWQHARPDETLEIDYRVLTHADEIDETMRETTYEHLPIDTEKDGPAFWSLQYSPAPGKGYLIHGDPGLLTRFRKAWRRNYKGLLFHERFGDLNLLESLGVWQEGEGEIRDTMQAAYTLGNQPQGLKALAWRRLGVRMQSWEDLVMPPSRRKMVSWLMSCWDSLAEVREVIEVPYKKPKKPGGKRPVKNPIVDSEGMITGRREYKPTPAERACKRILSHSHKVRYDIWKKTKEAGLSDDRRDDKWREQLDEREAEEVERKAAAEEGRVYVAGEDEEESETATRGLKFLLAMALEKEHGPPPIPSIANAPYAEAVHYACCDSDMTGRVASILWEELEGISEKEWYVAAEDYDAVLSSTTYH